MVSREGEPPELAITSLRPSLSGKTFGIHLPEGLPRSMQRLSAQKAWESDRETSRLLTAALPGHGLLSYI